MAKTPFSKFNLKVNASVVPVEFAGITFGVKQYLPLSDKLKFFTEVINESFEDNKNYPNPMRTKLFFVLGVFKYYTDISFTEKQLEDVFKLYDLIFSTGLWEEVVQNIPKAEMREIRRDLNEILDGIYSYSNSVMGVLENVNQNYDMTKLNIQNLTKELPKGEDLALVRDIVTKLG